MKRLIASEIERSDIRMVGTERSLRLWVDVRYPVAVGGIGMRLSEFAHWRQPGRQCPGYLG